LNQEELILQLKAGNELAFRHLVESSQDMVYNTVLGIVQDGQEAEDVSQEVFIQVYRSIRDFRGEAKLSTWLYRIAITKALDWQRKKKLRRGIHTLATWVGIGERFNEPVHFHHPGIQLEHKEKAATVFKAIQSLPENQRVCFLLLKTEGLSYEEVADILQVSIKAVESLMHRARENLRRKLEKIKY
jgi:RNA polymerase sigma factor (sigma-70 family)